jgi:outer membrane protein assembly factor BamB
MRKLLAIFLATATVFCANPLTTGSSGLVSGNDMNLPNQVSDEPDCDWPMFGRTPDGNRVVPDGCGITENSVRKRWSFKANQRIDGSCIIKGSNLYFGSDDQKLYSLDTETGNKIWEFQAKGIIKDSPAFYGESVFFGSYDNYLYCLDKNTGSKKWTYKCGNWVANSPVLAEDKIYIGSGDSKLYCFQQSNCAKVWEFRTGNIISVSPVYSNGMVYCASDDNALYCVDAKTGKMVWNFIAGWSENGSLLVNDDKIYFKSKFPTSMMFCLNANNGSVVWGKDFKDNITSSAIIYKNKLYLGSDDKNLYCLDPRNGKEIWKFKTKGWVCGSPIASNRRIVFGSDDGKLYCVDSESGSLIWEYSTGNPIRSAPVISNKKIYFGNNTGEFFCLEDYNKPLSIPSKIELIRNYDEKISICQMQKFSAKVLDQNNNEIKDVPIQWSVDPEFGSIDADGIFIPKKPGKVRITCRSGDLTESVEIEVIEYLSANVESLSLVNVWPDKDYKTTITYTNNSGKPLDVKLDCTLPEGVLKPSEFVIDPGKSVDVLFSFSLDKSALGKTIDFAINATYPECQKVIPGYIAVSQKYDCLTFSPETLDFGMLSRGNSMTLELKVTPSSDAVCKIEADNPWLIIDRKVIEAKKGIPETIKVTIRSSSLPPSTKLNAIISIVTDSDRCNIVHIPVYVQTEDSIAIKLQVDSKKATINGQERDLDVPATIAKGRTMVPLRFISEAFGCSVEWDKDTQRIGIIRYDISVNLWIGKDYVEVNGQQLKIDAPPVIIGGRTMVPLRFIAEPFGAQVNWNAQTKEITIIWPKP